VDRRGSPLFPEFHGAIVAAAVVLREVALQFPQARKYEPLDTMTITNNSDESLTLTMNSEEVALIPARTTVKVSDRPIYTYTLTNISATDTSADEVHVLLQAAPLSADKLARRG
jgi:hypothetical protein